jgi:hypothetical protein
MFLLMPSSQKKKITLVNPKQNGHSGNGGGLRGSCSVLVGGRGDIDKFLEEDMPTLEEAPCHVHPGGVEH